MAKPRSSPESALYQRVTELLEAEGLRVWEQATIRAGDIGTKTPDHVAWRWDGDEIDAVAVEVKAGNADIGLAQAVAYGVGFRHVYVAAEEALAETGYLAKVFDRLGLGYIQVTPRRAVVKLRPEESAFISAPVCDENAGRIRLKELWKEEVVGEPTIFGTDRRGPAWGVSGTMREWQICVLLYPNSTHAFLSLVAESTGLGRAVAARTAPDVLFAAIERLGSQDEIEVRLRRREHRFEPRYQNVATWRPSEGAVALTELLTAARAITGHSIGPWFEIRTNLWPHALRLTHADARTRLRTAIDRMRPVRENLNNLIGT